MISSQMGQEISGFDETISPDDPDFQDSGLKLPSLVRVSRLAVVNADVLVGSIGRLSNVRLTKIRRSLSEWLQPS